MKKCEHNWVEKYICNNQEEMETYVQCINCEEVLCEQETEK